MNNNEVEIELKILDSRWGTEWNPPKIATDGSAAIDLRAAIDKSVEITPLDKHLIPTGLAMHIKNKSIAGFIYPRSGMGHKKGLVLGNGTGVIDSDYQGEIMVSLINRSQVPSNKVKIEPGERIAQMCFVPVFTPNFILVSDFSNDTERGSGGFGHTGNY